MRYLIEFIAIGSIVFLELTAISYGIDGKVLSFALGLIAGIGGFEFGRITGRLK